jgi:hypothetical protein
MEPTSETLQNRLEKALKHATAVMRGEMPPVPPVWQPPERQPTGVVITKEFLKSGEFGNLNREQLNLLGVERPLRHGWRKALIGKTISEDVAKRFMELKGTSAAQQQRKARIQADWARADAARAAVVVQETAAPIGHRFTSSILIPAYCRRCERIHRVPKDEWEHPAPNVCACGGALAKV